MTAVKFCGMTREEDIQQAVRLGASYVGAIMTESPRRVEPARARELFEVIGGAPVLRVGVFGNEPIEAIIDAARAARLDVVQLHGQDTAGHADVTTLRTELAVKVWRVLRVGSDGLTQDQRAATRHADGILLDTLTRGALGGTGVAFDWPRVADDVRVMRSSTRIILAGGLRPENVRNAIQLLAPDVVDVSSGVESETGIKDHDRMAAFMNAVRQTSTAPAL